MFGSHVRIGLAVCALAIGIVFMAGPGAWAQAFGSRSEPDRQRPPHDYDWRPAPPAVHGFWGQRRWQRYSEDFGTRTVPAASHSDVRR